MLKSYESNTQSKFSKIATVGVLSTALLGAPEILNMRNKANAEVPVGNITPFTAATMENTNVGAVLQNFNGQQLNGVYLRTDTHESGITKAKDPKVNASVLFRDNNSQNYQINTKLGDFYPYANVAVNQGKVETATGVFGEFKASDNLKVTGLVEIVTNPNTSKLDTLIRAGVGYKF